jgi:DNA-binding NtrC family response regulator
MARVLLVEDEANGRRILTLSLRSRGHDVQACPSSEKAFELLGQERFDIILTDLRLHGRDAGLDVIRKSSELQPEARVLLVSAYASLDTAVAAMREGAFDYLTKPVSSEDLALAVERALADRVNRTGKQDTSASVDPGPHTLIGSSMVMERLRDRIVRVAKSDHPVLILGEPGTGKGLAAHMIHRFSHRSHGPFVRAHCGAMPTGMHEAEIFGNRDRSYSGGSSGHQGLLGAAEGGTLFLEEVNEIPMLVQLRLFRFLEQQKDETDEGKIRDKGVRIVAASSRDLSDEVREGRFRKDLFYHLNVVPIYMPPLRHHREDIDELVSHFLDRWRGSEDVPGLSQPFMDKLKTLSFTGNVRELEILIQRAMTLRQGKVLDVSLLDELSEDPMHSAEMSLDAFGAQGIRLDDWLDEMEKRMISQALEKSGGNITRAATLLGISFRSLRYRLHKLGLHGRDE